MDGELNIATQGTFGHWELTPEPLSPSHPPLHSINYHTTATLPPVFRTPLVQKEKGRKARKAKRGFGFRQLVQRGRMLITLVMKRAEKSQGVWGCHRAEAWVELPRDAAQTLTQGRQNPHVQQLSQQQCHKHLPVFKASIPRSDQIQGIHTQSGLLVESAYLLWHKHFPLQLKHFEIFQINTEDWHCSSRETTWPAAQDCGLRMVHSFFLEIEHKDTKDNLILEEKEQKGVSFMHHSFLSLFYDTELTK